jgi:hypothetical protein
MDFSKTLIIGLVMISCANPERSCKARLSKSASMVHVSEPEVWSNPNIIIGSSFGNIINTAYRLKNFELLYLLTDSTTRKKYSKLEITDIYSTLGLGFDMRLLDTKIDSGNFSMSYEVVIDATKQIIRLPVVVQNDTCRLLLIEFSSNIDAIKR